MSRVGWADLHHHTEHSLLDGFGSVRHHVERAKELGHSAAAFTEHGTMRGFVEVDAECKRAGIKPIFGVEFYVCRDHRLRGLTEEQRASVTAGLKGAEAREAERILEGGLGLQERRHLCVLAEHEGGLENLFRLNEIANSHGYYYKPRIDLDLLLEHGEGLWASSACLGGVLAKSMFEGDEERVYRDARRLWEGLEGRFSLEIQPHPGPHQAQWNALALRLSRDLKIPLLATNDSHYVVTEDHYAHDALIALGYKKTLDDPDRIRYTAESFALKSEEDLLEAFKRDHPDIPGAVVQAAIERGAEVAERCNASLYVPPAGTVLLPSPRIEEETPDDELRELCLDGWGFREIPRRARETGRPEREYIEQLAHELRVVKDLGFSRYFLILFEVLNWARGRGVMIGPGRGSGAGSLVCFLLGITALDPLEHGLLFERFLTPGRKDWPDLDIDIEIHRRHELLEHLAEVYGEDCVAQMGTFARMRGRAALRDVARVHRVPAPEVNAVVSSIIGTVVRADDEEDGSIAEALETSEALREFAEKWPDVIDDVLALEGHIRHVGIHPAGVICSPVPLGRRLPLERRTSNGEEKLVIGYDMRHVESLGFVKIDLLGLKTLSILADAVRTIRRRTGEDVDLERLRFDDPKVFDLFTEGDFTGVFQFDTPSARDGAAGVVFNCFDDVTGFNAINRPGPMTSGLADDWRDYKAAGRARSVHPILDEICADAYGVIIYQEHIIRLLQRLAGFSPAASGKLRKMIAKSKGAGALHEFLDEFVEGASRNGMDPHDAAELWTQIEAFGAYGFNKSHAAAYAALAYWAQWLKVHHPLEFFGALLANETDAGKAGRYVRDAARRGIEVSPPAVNVAAATWTVTGGAIVAGVRDVKGVGERACEEILEHAPYTSFGDFVARVNRAVVNRGVVDKLARAGALGEFVPNPRWLVENLPAMTKRFGKSKGWIAKVDDDVAAAASEPGWSEEDRWAEALSVGVHGRGEHPLGVLKTLDAELLRRTWGSLEHPHAGDVLRGIVTARKVGTAKGKRWAYLEVEDEVGAKLRLRLDDASFHANRAVVDLGVGALVAARVKITQHGSVQAEKLYDLLGLRSRWFGGEDLLEDDLVLTRDYHPANRIRGCEPEPDWYKRCSSAEEVVHVSAIRFTRTKSSGRKMAFVLLDAGSGPAVEAVVFSDVLARAGDVYPGDVVDVRLRRDKSKGGLLVESLRTVTFNDE